MLFSHIWNEQIYQLGWLLVKKESLPCTAGVPLIINIVRNVFYFLNIIYKKRQAKWAYIDRNTAENSLETRVF